jgi:hypothetical protein
LIAPSVDTSLSHYTFQILLVNGLAVEMSAACRKIAVGRGPLSWHSLAPECSKVKAVIYVFHRTTETSLFVQGLGF